MATDRELSLTSNQRSELSSIAQSRTLPAGYVFRAKLILMLAEGASFNTIKRRLQTRAPTIIRWKQRFLESGLEGLDTYHPGQKATVLTPASKAADIIGLYLRPPQHAAVFCVDEKTAIQALDRLDPVLPLSPGRAERHGFEYYRHGTLSLYAALDTKTGRVHGRTTARHTSRDFVAFLEEVVAYQVEIWFSKIEREVIARSIFTSVPDLARKLRRYINAYSANARPIQWKYSDPSRRLHTNEFTATVQLVTRSNHGCFGSSIFSS